MTEQSTEQSSEASPGLSPVAGEHLPEPVPPERRRILLRLLLAFSIFTLIAFSLLAWYVTTDSFQQIVRRRVVASIEKIVGGRVELGELHTIPFRLRVDARNLVIHGREGPDQLPFLQVDRLQAELKIVSLLSKTVGLHSLALEHPVIHIIDYPDGTTNVPTPPVRVSTGQDSLEELISLSVSRIEVQRGEALWENKKQPFDFSARDFELLSKYSLLRRKYEAHIVAGNISTRIGQYPSFVWRADAHIVLALGRMDVNALTLATGNSELTFTGHLLDFHNPHVIGDYHGHADLGALAAMLREPQVRKGNARFEGKGSWSLRDFATQGTLEAKDIDWAGGKLSTTNGRIAANFTVTPERLHIASIKGNLLGGDFQGDAEITNWQHSRSPSSPSTAGRRRESGREVGRTSAANPERGSVRLQLSGFPLRPGMQFISSKTLPLDDLNLSGNVSGGFDLLWIGAIHDAEARLNLDIVPPQKFAPGEVPARGRVDGVYRGSRDELEMRELRLATSGSEITASGNLAPNSALRFSITSHNLREVAPLLAALYGSPDLPFAVHGWATLNGNAGGQLSDISVNGNLEVYDFDTTFPATRRVSSKVVHWDALSAAIQYSNDHFAARNGSLIHSHTTAHFETSATLVGNRFPPTSPFTLHFDLHNADVAELAHDVGSVKPFAGALNLTATISGTRASPHGDGHLEVHNASAYGMAVPSLNSDLRLSGDELQFNNIDMNLLAANLSGSVAVSTADLMAQDKSWWNTGYRLNLSGRNFALSNFPRLQTSQFAADGTADFTLRAEGTPEEPTIEAHARLKDLAFDHERAGDFYIDALTRGRLLEIKSHSEFDKAELSIQGTVGLERNFPADLSLTFTDLDADALLRIYFPGKITGHSPSAGTLQVRGPLRNPRELTAIAELQSFSVEVGHVQVKSVEPIRLEIVNQSLLLRDFHLAGSGTDFTAHGRAHLADAKELDVRLDGSVNMTLLQTLNPKISARGTLGVNLNASGTITEPVLQGRIEVKNTFVSHNDFPSGLSDLNGALLFDRNRVQIESLSGTTGGGNIALTGSATYQNGIYQLDFGATASGVRLRYPPGVSSTANADLRLTGNTNSALLSGNVLVTKLAVTPGFDFGAYVEKSRQTTVLSQTDSLQSRLKMDVHVVTTPELQMQTAVARLSGNADLRVRGTAQRPAILGRVEVLEGEVTFNGTKYKLERGDVTFANPAKTQPVIDLQATTRVRDYDITVQFRGDASVANGLKVTWQSEPQLPQADVIALLALGRTQEESAAVASTSSFGFGGDASNLLINQALNSTLNSRLQRLFGASRVKIDPQGLASDTAVVRGPQVTVEQQVANNLTLTYSTNIEVSNQQIIQVEYNITRNVSIVALRDWNGVVSFDFKVRRRKK